MIGSNIIAVRPQKTEPEALPFGAYAAVGDCFISNVQNPLPSPHSYLLNVIWSGILCTTDPAGRGLFATGNEKIYFEQIRWSVIRDPAMALSASCFLDIETPFGFDWFNRFVWNSWSIRSIHTCVCIYLQGILSRKGRWPAKSCSIFFSRRVKSLSSSPSPSSVLVGAEENDGTALGKRDRTSLLPTSRGTHYGRKHTREQRTVIK